jgi:hypothetical protein
MIEVEAEDEFEFEFEFDHKKLGKKEATLNKVCIGVVIDCVCKQQTIEGAHPTTTL